MNIDDHALCCFRFKQMFDDAEPPTWQQCRDLERSQVMAAILRVKANPLTKFNSRPLLAGLVMQAAAKGKRSRLVGGK